MNPFWHFLFGAILSLFLLFLFPEIGIINISILFFSSILIDADHYFFYIYEKRGFNLRKAYSYFLNNKKKMKELEGHFPSFSRSSFFIFHGLEVILLVFLLSFLFKPFYFVFMGLSFHLILDLFEQAVYSKSFQKISVVNDFLNYKR
jgi:hypothetical protein